MKNDLPWFKHYNGARNHPKMKALRGKYGPTGYGRFWMLNEIISDAPEARLDLSRKIYLLSTAQELGLELAEFEDFLTFLSDPEIDLINYVDGIVTTDQTQEDYVVVVGGRQRKRGMGKSSAEKRENSAENDENSAEKSNRAEQSRAEQNRKELASLPAAAVDNFLAQASEVDLAELYAFALARGKADPKVKSPGKWAKSVMREPDIIEAFLESKPKPTAPEDIPPICPDCERPARIFPPEEPGKPPYAVCEKHRRLWTFNDYEIKYVEDLAHFEDALDADTG